MAESSESEEENVRNLRVRPPKPIVPLPSTVPPPNLGSYVDDDLEQITAELAKGIKKAHDKLKEDWRKEEKKDSDDELKEPRPDEDYSDGDRERSASTSTGKRGRTRRIKGRSVATIIRMRRTRFRNKLPISTEATITPVSKSFLEFKELIYRVGDVVKLRIQPNPRTGRMEDCYAQIRGFYRDQFCGKYGALQWLYPTQPKDLLQNKMDVFDPAYFVQGQTHPEPVELDKLIFVRRLPPSLLHYQAHDQRLIIGKDGRKEYMDGVSTTISNVESQLSFLL